MKKNLFILSLAILLAGCTGSPSSSQSSSKVSESSSISLDSSSQSPSSSLESSESSLSIEESSAKSSVESSVESSAESSSETSVESSLESAFSSNEESSGDSISSEASLTSLSSEASSEIEFEKTLLDCGYYQMDLPKNKDNPYTLKTTLSADDSTWSNNYMYDSLPNSFRFIYGNSSDDGEPGHRASPKFYSYDEDKPSSYPGGLRFDQKSKGFETPLFIHEGAKLEIRIGISQVNNCSDKYEAGKDTMGVYYFSKDGKYLGKHRIEEGSITTKTKELKFYETSDFTKDIAYFEVRLIAMAYKGSQCYNVGIGYCNYKSWERI